MLLALDDIGLSAHVALMVNNSAKYKQVLSRRGSSAQALLNLLQAVCLDSCPACVTHSNFQQRLNFPIDAAYKLRHIETLIRLSRASGLYPECLVLKGINIEGNAVAGGTFGDIYKGHLGDQTIAVKVLRAFTASDRDHLLKVA
jgi:hypothetical protein